MMQPMREKRSGAACPFRQNELVSTLYKEDLTGELMRETDDVAERRRISREMLALLKKAVNIVSEVRDFNPFLG